MTGDGVNDVLALREADVSIAMAAGDSAARQIANFVLLDSDFTTLPDVLFEGRRVVNNVTSVGNLLYQDDLQLLALFGLYPDIQRLSVLADPNHIDRLSN